MIGHVEQIGLAGLLLGLVAGALVVRVFHVLEPLGRLLLQVQLAFGHGLGHGVGIDIHENPRLSMTCHDTVQAGHILTVEPGIYLPGVGGVRIEDTCLVTPEGNEPLTPATKELIIL